MGKYFTFIIILFVSAASAFTPQPGSPLALHSHPRLHITQATIPTFRQFIAADFSDKYQEYVNWAFSTSDNDKYNIINEAAHDPLRALMIHQAFIAAIGAIPGISYPGSLNDLAQRAANSLIKRLNAGDDLSYAAALVYDWTYNYLSESQREQIANLELNRRITHIIYDHSIANPSVTPELMFSSRYYEGCYAWYIALAFWGDGFIDSAADKALDTFTDVMLKDGFLDALNFVAGNDGGWPEWNGYSSWHPRTHILNIDAWHTATGENYISGKGDIDGNAILNYPKLITQAMDPHKYYDQHFTYVRAGDASTTDASFEHRSVREQMYLLPRVLNDAGLLDMAGLVRYTIENYNVLWPRYKHYYLWAFLGLYTSVPVKNASDLGMPNSLWARNMGTFFARTGHNNPGDGVFSYNGGHFRFDGHRGAEATPGFALLKYGTLVNTRHVAHRGYGNLNDYPGGREFNTVYFDGVTAVGHDWMSTAQDVANANSGQGDFEWGGIEQVTKKNNEFYHLRTNQNRVLPTGTTHSRELVYIPGKNPVQDTDFLVVYDRTASSFNPEWVYHVPWKPSVYNYQSTEDFTLGSGLTGRIGDAFTGSAIFVKGLNGTGGPQDSDGGDQDYVGGANAHGVVFCRTILPQNIRVEVSRVTEFDNDVLHRQGDLAIKSHRWQVSVKPTQSQKEQRFLNVFQTGEETQLQTVTGMELIEVGAAMQGVLIQAERSGRQNNLVLFSKENSVNENAVAYSVSQMGPLMHIITGIKPYTIYDIQEISDSGTKTFQKNTESNLQLWDYKGVAQNQPEGVLSFETNITENTTYVITISGEQDTTAPVKPQGLHLK